MLPNSTQAQTTLASLVGVAAGFAAGHGWLGLDAASWGTIFAGLFATAAVVWPAVVTRLQSLKNTVGNNGAKVITDAASANALPNNPNVIAATPEIAAAVAKAQ